MKCHQEKINVATGGRSFVDCTSDIQNCVARSNVSKGICNVFVQHTSASIILCENADPDVRRDLEAFMKRLVTDGDDLFLHRDEGIDDMSAHIRTVLTQSSLTIPVAQSTCLLGIWQGIYVWEHRMSSFNRNMLVTVYGE